MIHNGKETMAGQFPWVVYVGFFFLRRTRLNACAGTIINDRFILTSAHCLVPLEPHYGLELGVWIGGDINPVDLRLKDALQIKGWIQHENYIIGDYSTDDVALIELQVPLHFNTSFSPICLPDFSHYDNLFVAGWGFVGNPETEPTNLMHADLAIIPDEVCHEYYDWLSEHEMCAGDEERNVCLGDSGAPLMTRRLGIVYQAGITAAGTTMHDTDCGLTAKPSIFEKVIPFLPWIREMVGPDAKWCDAPFQAITNDQRIIHKSIDEANISL